MSEITKPNNEAIGDAVDKAKNKTEQFAGAAQKKFGEAIDSPEHEAKGAARQATARVSEALNDAAAGVREQVRENPLIGLAAIGTIGLLLGFILGRK
ncbi:CsbD family protein [Acerihabitans arboris]|uniref:CsbD family protein n=1 Tax=Acerihabitans arboris TaxID=2691583 RepID=A0A845SQS0_9GAMM|nr:CsbD family protein [Acerihabitans arboris]NDL64921.1 CsbD family protein [Acerihabitans arboris]